jgi:hypothetical protein
LSFVEHISLYDKYIANFCNYFGVQEQKKINVFALVMGNTFNAFPISNIRQVYTRPNSASDLQYLKNPDENFEVLYKISRYEEIRNFGIIQPDLIVLLVTLEIIGRFLWTEYLGIERPQWLKRLHCWLETQRSRVRIPDKARLYMLVVWFQMKRMRNERQPLWI